MPRSWSLRAVTGPTPTAARPGGWRKAISPSGGTTGSPSGLATPLATLARNFVRATPTVIASPTSSRTRPRASAAMSAGSPDTRRRPVTSRKASSIEPLDQRRGLLEHLEHRLAGLRVRRHAGLDTASGQRRRACRPPMAVHT